MSELREVLLDKIEELIDHAARENAMIRAVAYAMRTQVKQLLSKKTEEEIIKALIDVRDSIDAILKEANVAIRGRSQNKKDRKSSSGR